LIFDSLVIGDWLLMIQRRNHRQITDRQSPFTHESPIKNHQIKNGSSLNVFDILASERFANAAVHHDFGQVLRGVIERMCQIANRVAIGAADHALQLGERLVDPLQLTWLQLLFGDPVEVGMP
jgi:hypothetical protein